MMPREGLINLPLGGESELVRGVKVVKCPLLVDIFWLAAVLNIEDAALEEPAEAAPLGKSPLEESL